MKPMYLREDAGPVEKEFREFVEEHLDGTDSGAAHDCIERAFELFEEVDKYLADEVLRLREAVAAERERCARIAEEWGKPIGDAIRGGE